MQEAHKKKCLITKNFRDFAFSRVFLGLESKSKTPAISET